MKTNAAIDNFIKKYRLAHSSKAKDFRLTIEEAGDLVASIALITSDREDLEQLKQSIDTLAAKIEAKPEENNPPAIDGGSFKN